MLFYYPNRPTLVPPDPTSPLRPRPDYINGLEKTGKYIAEFKWNGDNTTVYTDDLSFYNREGKLLSYKPHPDLIKELKVFPKGCILNGELMHRHTKNVKDLLILHAVMKWKDKVLLGKTWQDSRAHLVSMNLPQTDGVRLDYDQHLLVAQDHTEKFWDLFQLAYEQDDAVEGIVLKNPAGKLQFSVSPISDVSWMLKIRKPSKKYRF